MKILSVAIKNYKSFKKYNKVAFKNKNIITGKNGSGKSNFLSAIFSVFMHEKFAGEKNVHFNRNEEDSFIEVELDNSCKSINYDASKIFLKKSFNFNNEVSYFINSKPISPSEMKHIICNQVKYNFVDQNFLHIENVEEIISDISGATAFESTKNEMLRTINTNEIELMLEKLDYKRIKYNEYANKFKEFKKLDDKRKEIVHKLRIHEIAVLNEEIEKMGLNYDKTIQGEENLLAEVKLEETRKELMNLFKEKQKLNFILKSTTTQNKNCDYKEIETKYEKLVHDKKEAEKSIFENETKIHQKTILIQALKYFNASGTQKEDLNELLEKQKELKKSTKDIKNRKQHFQNINEVKTEIQEITKKQETLKNRLLYVGNQQFNVYDQIKDIEGVIGIVYDLINVEEKYLKAFEAVGKSALSYILVENKNIAELCIKKISSKARCTFIDLETIIKNHRPIIKSNVLTYLEDKVASKYPELVSFLCKGHVFSETINKAINLSKKYDVNVVTSDGDLVNIKGSITGGFDTKNDTMLEIITCKNKLKYLNSLLKKLNQDTVYLDLELDQTSKLAYLKFLEFKIELHKNKTIKLNPVKTEEMDLMNLNKNLMCLKSNLQRINIELTKLQNNNYLVIHQMTKKLEEIEKNLLAKKEEETKLIKMLFSDEGNSNIEEVGRKNILLEKRGKIMKEMGIVSFKNIKKLSDPNKLNMELKRILVDIKSYSMFNFNIKGADKMLDIENVKDGLNELLHDKEIIYSYVEYLEEIKTSKIKEVFTKLALKFNEIFKMLTGLNGHLVLNETSELENKEIRENKSNTSKRKNINDLKNILFVLNDEQTHISALSGGQKTMFGMCILLSIQLIYNESFLILDEFDSNLDPMHCKKIHEFLNQMESQAIISSFKKESLIENNNFIGVELLESKESIIKEITHADAFLNL